MMNSVIDLLAFDYAVWVCCVSSLHSRSSFQKACTHTHNEHFISGVANGAGDSKPKTIARTGSKGNLRAVVSKLKRTGSRNSMSSGGNGKIVKMYGSMHIY